MANTTTADELTYFSFPISKFTKTDDGDLVVYGKATDGSVDSDEQIVDPAWSAKALMDWHDSGGNVRVQHQALRDPAGKSAGVEIDRDGDSGHWVKSLVVEPVAKRLVEKGVLTAYSVGIARPVIKRDPTGKARGGIVCGGHLAELSLVDRPANKSCGLVLAKAEGGSKDMELVSETGELFGEPGFLAKYETDDILTKSDDAAEDPDLVKDGGSGDSGSSAPASANAPGQASEDAGESGDTGTGGDDDTDTDDTDDADAVSKADKDTQVAYRAARKEWLGREPAVSKAVGGTEYLQARAAWMRWNAEGEGEGLTGTRDGAMLWLAKRGQDPSVLADLDAGYVEAETAVFKRDVNTAERRQLASAGNALPDGSYPIKNASDLENAATLARSGHGDVAAARRLIARRAKELNVPNPLSDDDKIKKETAADDGAAGQADTLKAGANSDGTAGDNSGSFAAGKKPCPTCKGDGKIMGNNRTCPDCNGTGKVPSASKDDEPQVVKGSRDCKGCGKSYDADAANGFCGNCGKKLPSAKKAAKQAKRASLAPASIDARPVSDEAILALAETVAKSVAAGILTQEAGDALITEAVEKKRSVPASTSPAGTHREPDGTSTVEDLEPDAGMATDPDKTPDKVPSSVSSLGTNARPTSGTGPSRKTEAPYAVQRMHDVACAAYSNDVIKGEYAALTGFADAFRADWFSRTAAEHAAAGRNKKAARWMAAAEEIVTLKGLDPDAVEDGRAQLHKSFSDMYPTEKITPTMGAVMPGKYQRPYLSAGHAAMDAAHNGGSKIPPSTHTPEPEDFHRPLITDGHEADSPANKDAMPATPGGNKLTDVRNNAPVRSGASRVYYTNAQREAARVAMQNIHDHISSNFPDMCPMASSKSVLPPDMGAGNVPTVTTPRMPGGVGDAVKTDISLNLAVPPVVSGPALQQQIADAIRRHSARVTTSPQLTRKQLEKAAADLGCELTPRPEPAPPLTALTADEFKAMLTEQITPLAERYESALGDLQKQLDDLGSQPDPALAPVRGALAKAAPGPAVPVERRSLVDEARDRAQAEEAGYRTYIESLTKSPNPMTRERALSVLTKLAGSDA